MNFRKVTNSCFCSLGKSSNTISHEVICSKTAEHPVQNFLQTELLSEGNEGVPSSLHPPVLTLVSHKAHTYALCLPCYILIQGSYLPRIRENSIIHISTCSFLESTANAFQPQSVPKTFSLLVFFQVMGSQESSRSSITLISNNAKWKIWFHHHRQEICLSR